MNSSLRLSDEVATALAAGRPVVALESTIISHGLPRPRNHQAALEFESILRDAGVTPATIAMLDGVPRIGLDAEGVRRIADEDLAKASVRDLPILAARGASGATTVAATAHLAAMAGIRCSPSVVVVTTMSPPRGIPSASKTRRRTASAAISC